MNVADSVRTASALEKIGYQPTQQPGEADVIVLNTCVVRESAEIKAVGRLTSLKGQKRTNPDLVINLMGCMVGIHDYTHLKERFPYVDVFSQPSDPYPLLDYLQGRHTVRTEKTALNNILDTTHTYTLPATMKTQTVSAFLPIVFGCSHACSYCIIPLRRGKEISRPAHEIMQDAYTLAEQGVKEITLLGQIVDRYGVDHLDFPKLSDLLYQIHEISSIKRIRFLTSHPNWMSDDILDAVAALPKVMPHFELPNQAGDDDILKLMGRGYITRQYYEVVEKIRARIQPVSIATDIIVGFPGETEDQFEKTVESVKTVRPDMTHAARYSPRPGTLSARKMVDDVPDDEKMRRFRVIEKLQEQISTEINASYLDRQVPVLFEEKNKDRWRGRTPTNKLVFVKSDENIKGEELDVAITWTGPWSMIGTIPEIQK